MGLTIQTKLSQQFTFSKVSLLCGSLLASSPFRGVARSTRREMRVLHRSFVHSLTIFFTHHKWRACQQANAIEDRHHLNRDPTDCLFLYFTTLQQYFNIGHYSYFFFSIKCQNWKLLKTLSGLKWSTCAQLVTFGVTIICPTSNNKRSTRIFML